MPDRSVTPVVSLSSSLRTWQAERHKIREAR
nr:MAG TPA: hypothetical protein [Bacteriophage sp.]